MFPGRAEHQDKYYTLPQDVHFRNFRQFYDFGVAERVKSLKCEGYTLGSKSPDMASLIMVNSAMSVGTNILHYVDSTDYHSLLEDCYSTFFFNFTARHIEHVRNVLRRECPCAEWEAEFGKMVELRERQMELLEFSGSWVNEFHNSLEFSHSFSRTCLYNAYQYRVSINPLAVLRSSKPELADVICCTYRMIHRLELLISSGSSLFTL
jgi:hypothetical protein